VIMSRVRSGWRDALLIVQPETVIRWHKKAVKLYWRRKSQAGRRGRPGLDADVKALILKMAEANPFWGAPKIHGELLKLGIAVSERTVSGVLPDANPNGPLRLGEPSSRTACQTWSV
jgi:putative transposase